MISFIYTSTKKGPVIVTAEDGSAPIFTIELPNTGQGKARICKNGRVRYVAEIDWEAGEKGSSTSHPEQLSLPYRLTDALGHERGWLIPLTAEGALVDSLQLTVDGTVLDLNVYHCMDDVSIYRGKTVVASVTDLGNRDISRVRVTNPYNDYVAELAVLAALFFFQRNGMVPAWSESTEALT